VTAREIAAKRYVVTLSDEGAGNPAFIDFEHPREWLVIPPDGVDIPATKIEGESAPFVGLMSKPTTPQSPSLSGNRAARTALFADYSKQ